MASPIPEPSWVRERAFDAMEALEEEMSQLLWGNTDPGVGHPELDLFAQVVGGDFYAAFEVNFRALERRLRTIFSHMPWSTNTGERPLGHEIS